MSPSYRTSQKLNPGLKETEILAHIHVHVCMGLTLNLITDECEVVAV